MKGILFVLALGSFCSVAFSAESVKPIRIERHLSVESAEGVHTVWAIVFSSRPALSDVEKLVPAIRNLMEKEGASLTAVRTSVSGMEARIAFVRDERKSRDGANRLKWLQYETEIGGLLKLSAVYESEVLPRDTLPAANLLKVVAQMYGDDSKMSIAFSVKDRVVSYDVNFSGGSWEFVKGLEEPSSQTPTTQNVLR